MKRLGITLVILSLLVFFGMAYAAEKSVMNEKQTLANAVKVSMAAALATASKQVAGTVLAAEVENEDGKTMYCFEIMPTPTSTIVKEVKIDAITGAFLGTEDETATTEATEKAAESKESKSWAGKKGEKDEEGDNEGENMEKGEKGKSPIIFQFFINGEKVEKGEKWGKGEKSEKGEKGEADEKSEKGEKAVKAEKGEKSEKGAKEMKPAKEMKASKAKAETEKETEKDEKD
jgi:hypothetical protein